MSAKRASIVGGALSGISRWSIIALVFLVPLAAAPWTPQPLDLNKQAVMAVLAFATALCWLISAAMRERFSLRLSWIHLFLLLFVLAVSSATLLSVSGYGSFWGWPLSGSQNLFSLLLLLTVYAAIAGVFSRRDLAQLAVALALSTGIALLCAIAQAFGISFPGLGAAVPLGDASSAGLFAAVMLPLCVSLAAAFRGPARWVALADLLLIFAALALGNRGAWLAAMLAAGLMFVFFLARPTTFSGPWIFLPVFFFLLALFFIAVNPRLPWLAHRPQPFSLSIGQTLRIAVAELRQSPFLGSGPGTFAYDFLKYRGGEFTSNALWNETATGGYSRWFTDLATLGIAGVATLLLLLGSATLTVVGNLAGKARRRAEHAAKTDGALVMGTSSALAALVFGYFFVAGSAALDFLLIILLAMIAVLTSRRNWELALRPSSAVFVGWVALVSLAGIGGGWMLLLEGQHYLASVRYQQGLRAFAAGDKARAIGYLKTAATLSPATDLYPSRLALFSLSQMQDALRQPSGASQAQWRQLAVDAVNEAATAVRLGPNTVDNYLVKGEVCQELVSVAQGAADCAAGAYQKAASLDPFNPKIPLQEANGYLAQAQDQSLSATDRQTALANAARSYRRAIALKPDYAQAYVQQARVFSLQGNTGDEAQSLQSARSYAGNDAQTYLQIGIAYYRGADWADAQDALQRAIALESQYADAMYYLGLVYDAQGLKDQALTLFQEILRNNPDNAQVQTIIANLQAGRAALENAAAGSVPSSATR